MLAGLKLSKIKKATMKQLQKLASEGILENRCSEKFQKNYRKTTALESLFNKSAGLQQMFYRRTFEQLTQIFNYIWSTKRDLVKITEAATGGVL